MRAKSLALVALAIAAVLAVALVATYRTSNPNSEQLSKLHEYCTAVHVAFDEDARDFVSGSATRQERAVARFLGQVTYHSEQELVLCADQAPDMSRWTQCWQTRNYECLASLAQRASESVRR